MLMFSLYSHCGKGETWLWTVSVFKNNYFHEFFYINAISWFICELKFGVDEHESKWKHDSKETLMNENVITYLGQKCLYWQD